MSEPVIRADQLAFSYAAGLPVLQGVSFCVREGERIGIIGANGAGKSTLLSLLAGVMAPEAGELVVAGASSGPRTLEVLRANVGFVFQNPEDMLFMPTVEADVAFGPERRGLPPDEVKRLVHLCLRDTGAEHLGVRAPWSLSGGEKRIVSIAAVLAMEPRVLLMDEPSSDLDPGSRRDLIRLIRSLPGTVIVASHDLDMVLDLCERVLVLGGRTVAADGPASIVLRDASLLAANRLELPLRLQSCPHCGAGS